MNQQPRPIQWHPEATGYAESKPTLCLGLDIAWFGGSKSKPDSQYDFIAGIVVDANSNDQTIICRRLKLLKRDPEAEITERAICEVVESLGDQVERIVLAVDAPLQSIQGLPKPPRKRARRECENHLSKCRSKIDKLAGGAKNWHPNIQPGVPLAPRVTKLSESLCNELGFELWAEDTQQNDKIIIECFPSEAIWAAKRLGHYPESLTAEEVRSYKKQNKNRLAEDEIRHIVERTIAQAFLSASGYSDIWPSVVDNCLKWMLADTTWQTPDGLYKGGKLLDDVVDTTICLATAMSYAAGNAHLWRHPDAKSDGHIIGPGQFA